MQHLYDSSKAKQMLNLESFKSQADVWVVPQVYVVED